jgi:hypothetical protein
MGGGGSAWCRVEEGKRERERAPSATVSTTDRGVGMALGSAIRGGNARSRWRRAGEQGRAAGRGQRGATRLTGGAGRQWRPVVSSGVREEERKARQHDGGAPIGGPGPHSAEVRFKLGF